MKRRFTILTAALALLTFLAVPMGMWGQTRDSQTVSYGWETTDDATLWTISDAIEATSGEGNTGTYAGKINSNSTTVQFNEKVYVTSFSYAFKRTSNNNNYSVYIETSTDGSTWSIKDTQAMNTFTNGSYRTVTKTFDGTQELYVRFRCNNTTAVRYVDDVTITYNTSASQLDPCDLTLTNASTSIVFDLYNNSDAYVINYTTSSTGEVTVADSDYITTVVDQTNKTITVTPIAVTNGAKVITVNQAADDNYAAGSKTFTVNITNSAPSIVIPAEDLSLSYEANDNGSFSISFTNGFVPNAISPTFYSDAACENELPTSGDAAWIVITETNQTAINYSVTANSNSSNNAVERTAYLKVIATDYNNGNPLSITDVFAVTQAAPDFATLPFEFNNGKSAIAETNGLTQSGLGSDYADANTKLKFDNTDDYVILKINERPGILTFYIKGNSFSGGTFKVQTSADGESYSDLKTYTTFDNNETYEEEFDNLNENVRYIKWVYTNKSSGNVGLGNIALAKYPAVATPTFSPESGEVFTGQGWVELSCTTEGATIYYTLDGAVPTPGASGTFTYDPDAAIMLTDIATTTIKAVAYVGEEHSTVATASYTVVELLQGMEAICNAATQVGNTPQTVGIEFDSFIVSGVGSNKKRAFVTDNENGFIIYDSNGGLTFEAGQLLSGTVICQVRLLNGAPCITGINAGDFTITETGYYPNIIETTIDDLSACNTGLFVNLGVLTWNGSYFVDGNENGIQYYNTIYAGDSFTANRKYRVMGIYVYYSGGSTGIFNEIAPTDENDIVEVGITLDSYEINAPAAETEGTLYATYSEIASELGVEIHWFDAAGQRVQDGYDWMDADLDDNWNIYYTIDANDGEARTAYFKVYGLDEEMNEVYSDLVTISQAAPVAPVTGDKYVKVTSAADLTSGQYLIVYEELPVAFNGGLTTLDAVGNTIEVILYDDEIDITSETAAAEFTIDMTAGTIKSASGYYIGRTGDSNGMNTSATEAYTNTISIDDNGNAVVVASGGAYLRYNATSGQDRFRYFKSSSYTGQKAIQLYKKEEATPAGPTITVNGYGDTDGGYVLLAWPESTLPNNIEGMISDNLGAQATSANATYDLYSYDESEDKEWLNYRKNSFGLVPGKGYLYASKAGVTLTYEGEANPDFAGVYLPYTDNKIIKSIYLAGNSKTNEQTFYVYNDELAKQTFNYLTMNEDGNGFISGQGASYTAPAMTGFFVQAPGANMTLSTTDVNAKANVSLLNINVLRNRGSVIDNAIVSFSNGSMMDKFYLMNNTTRVYIPQGNREMAIANSAAQGELPVSFRAGENGTYTLSMNVENVEMNYLHLIDNMTGMDIDLLQTPSYTFEANTNDYANRFKLVFAANGANEADESSFAFFSNGNLIVNNEGNATLQVIDINGRILSSETISGSCSKAINATTGVYMLRLINGDNVKVQKVVVR